MKTIGIIQSNYLPWRGYFDFIREVDTFVFLDDVQYTRRDWRNRNTIKTERGKTWLTVPVIDKFGKSLICETRINGRTDWVGEHCEKLRLAYRKTPFFDRYYSELCELIASDYDTISELNQALCKWLALQLGISTPMMNSVDMGIEGRKSEKLLGIVAEQEGTRYLSGPSAKDYLDLDLFRNAGVEVAWKQYEYADYSQCWNGFIGDVSVVDMLFNLGEEARFHTKSQVESEPAW